MTAQRYGGQARTFWADDARQRGVALRDSVPRSSHSVFTPATRDPLAIIEEQNLTRVPDLVPLRMERMAASPFTFYRGTAALMAFDLATDPGTGIDVVACGDAHINNFGFFASPLRTLVFDLNDFDEAAVAPFEWDVKRLVTSAVIGARDFGYSEGQVFASAMAAASAYRRGLQEMMQLGLAERYYRRVDTTVIRAQLDTPGQVVLDQALAQARKRTSTQFVRKMTVLGDDGKRMFVEDPPVLTRIAASDREDLERLFRSYLRTVPADIALLLSQHELTDAARRVVGVGSVGTRCSVVLLTGPHHNPMVLQVKEALPSVLDTYGGARSRVLPDGAVSIPTRRAAHDGQRVVDNQRILQAVSDLFLGHLRFGGRDHYVRQFRDMKGSIDVELLGSKQFATYAAGCGTVLARAHSQSPNAQMIAGYLGNGPRFDRAVVEWSLAYADQSLADYRRFVAARSQTPSIQ